MLLANQRLFTRRESNFGGNNVSFEINSREKEIFKYVQMALPKKSLNVFFCDEILLAEAAVPLLNSYK